MGLTASSLPDASLGNVVSLAAVSSMVTQRDYWKRGCGEILIVNLVSFFRCCFRFSGIFCDIPSIKVYRLPTLQIFLAQGLQTRSEKFSSRSMEMPVFFKTSAIKTPRQSFLLEGLNRFSLNILSFERNFQTSF